MSSQVLEMYHRPEPETSTVFRPGVFLGWVLILALDIGFWYEVTQLLLRVF